MIYTVTCNPSLDYIIEVENLVHNEINRGKKEEIYPGGKGINVSQVLKNLGYDSVVLGFSAGFTGRELERLLQRNHLRTRLIQCKDGMTRINVKIQETQINGKGPFISPKELDDFFGECDKIREGDWLILSGSIPDGVPDTLYVDMMRRFEGKDVQIVVDASGKLLRKILPLRPFLIKPNHHELGELFSVAIDTYEKAFYYAKRLQEEGARNVLVSMGNMGAVLLDEEGNEYTVEAVGDEMVQTVGAGDSMVAGFVAGYIESNSFSYALQLGNAAGGATACKKGLATKEDIKKMGRKPEDA